ncbi:TPA: hypothetical protein ACYLN4_000880 [Burkholderia lata]
MNFMVILQIRRLPTAISMNLFYTHMCVLATPIFSFISEKFHSPIGRRARTAERRIGFPGLHRSQLAWAHGLLLKKVRGFGLGHSQAGTKLDELFSVGRGFFHRSYA